MTSVASNVPSRRRPKSMYASALSRQMEALLVEPHRQNELLASFSAAALQGGDYWAAFMFADRRCRRPTPSARDFLLRALASRRLGCPESATQDLARSIETDPTDELVISNALRWGPRVLRRIAAANVVAGASEDREALALALQAFKSEGVPIASHLHVRGDMYTGWIAWADARAVELRIRRAAVDSSFELEADPSHPLASDHWSAAEIAIEMESPQLQSVSFYVGGKLVLSAKPARFSHRLRKQRTHERCVGDARRDPPNHVDIIVPVYENYTATKACLESVEGEASRISKRIIVIDDCTPNARLRALLDEGASRGRFTLLRNDVNLGFARSVNLALARRWGGDVLLLNADTLLPQRAIDRLGAAAYAQPDVGTVTPLSNNGELTSFPLPNVDNALGAPDEIQLVDASAQLVNGREIIDMPTGVGFCLYISRSCADSVGFLSEHYARGYYEDVDFCLRALELGFRNVCATGVFVGHAGSKSFLDEKRTLVVRNLSILEARFPEHRLQCGAFLKADPLALARMKIEEHLAPEGAVALLMAPACSAHALALGRAHQIQSAAGDIHCILCEFTEVDSTVITRSLRASVPQSLVFAISDGAGHARFKSYLARLRVEAIEIFDPKSLPQELLQILSDLGTPLRIVFGDLQWVCSGKLALEKVCSNDECPGACDRCVASHQTADAANLSVEKSKAARMHEVLRRAEGIIPIDRMAAAFSASYLESLVALPCAPTRRKTISLRARPEHTILGIVCPEATGQTDRQIIAMGRMFRLRGIEASIIVLGRCVDELGVMASGNVFVTGAISRQEYPQAIEQYGVGNLFSPYRTRHFGTVDDIGALCGLKKAYFDWSFGSLEIDDGDLALDPRICVQRAALEVGAWLPGDHAREFWR